MSFATVVVVKRKGCIKISDLISDSNVLINYGKLVYFSPSVDKI